MHLPWLPRGDKRASAWLLLYVSTGAVQPLLVDRLRGLGIAPPELLGPMLANTLGMTLVGPLRECWGLWTGTGGFVGWGRTAQDTAQMLWVAILLDFCSAVALCIGLLECGAATFTLVYSSVALVVSVLGTCAGARLSHRQWGAVAGATAGMIAYHVAQGKRTAGDYALEGPVLAFLGSVGHGGMFVYAEHALGEGQKHGLTPFRLSTLMGAAQAAALLVWCRIAVYLQPMLEPWPEAGFSAQLRQQDYEDGLIPYDPSLGPRTLGNIVLEYVPLVAVACGHAMAFFAMLGDRGAVSASMLKGVQVLVVFGASSLLFCDPAGGPNGGECATPAKTAAVLLVSFSLTAFYSVDPPRLKASAPLPVSPEVLAKL